MSKIRCMIVDHDLPGDYDGVSGVTAVCSHCEHETESYGDSDASAMREERPPGESNYYVEDVSI